MDSHSRNLFAAFKDQVLEELGLLNPNWFDELTILASNEEGDVFEQDMRIANKNECFKTPLKKSSDSQLFSTPKFFKRKCTTVLSPENEEEQSYLQKDNETLPHTVTSSGLVWASEKGVFCTEFFRNVHPQDSFELLYRPQNVGHTQHISESLGVQVNADLSWTSSLNTPPAIPSTIILTKKENSPCPMSPSADKDAIIVRTLFPSLSNATAVAVQSPTLPQVRAVDYPEASQAKNVLDSSMDQCGCDWRQTLPDAIEDNDIRSNVAHVEGTEHVLSIFLTNSSSSLRRVKTTDRIKRKHSILIDKQGCLLTNALTAKCVETCDREDETKPEDIEIVKNTTPQTQSKVNTVGESQWSPMSLSDISQCDVAKSHQGNNSNTQWKSSLIIKQKCDSDASQVITSAFKNSGSLFFKKRRKFVYTIPSQNPQVQEKPLAVQEIESPSGQNLIITQEKTTSLNAKSYKSNIYDGQHESKTHTIFEETLSASAQVKGQDLDMSQLCRAFAQDFTQMPDLSKPGSVDQDACHNGFTPSACLISLKQSFPRTLSMKQCIHEEHIKNNTHLEESEKNNNCKLTGNLILSNQTHSQLYAEQSTVKQPSTMGVDKKSYTIANNNASFNSVGDSGFKTASNGDTCISSVNLDNTKCLFEDIEDGTQIEKTQKSVENVSKADSTSSRETHILNNQSLLTASQKADITELCCLLEEADTQFEFTQYKYAPLSGNHLSLNKADKEVDPDFLADIDFDDSFSSQAETNASTSITLDKVTSICQGKNTVKIPAVKCKFPGKLKETSAADALADVSAICTDSFNKTEQIDTNNPENQNPVLIAVGFKTARGTALGISNKCLSKARDLFADLKDIPIIISDNGVSSNIKKCISGLMSVDQQFSETDGQTKPQPNVSSNHSVHSFLSEESDSSSKRKMQVSDVKLNEQNNKPTRSKVDKSTRPREKCSFQMTSGKCIPVSTNALIKDCDFMGTIDNRPPNCDVQEEPVNGCAELKKVNAGPSADYGEILPHVYEQVESKIVIAKTADISVDANSSMVQPITLSTGSISKSVSSSDREFSGGVGFCTASGKGVFVSDDSLTKAKYFLREYNIFEDHNHKDPPKTFDFTTPVQVPLDKISRLQTAVSMQGNSLLEAKPDSSSLRRISNNDCSAFIGDLHNERGFSTASGKNVSVSDTALKKAMSLQNECDPLKDEKLKVTLGTGHLNAPVQAVLTLNAGFQTASGKGVLISTTALQKAKGLLNKTEDTNDKNELQMSPLDFANMEPPANTIGFSTPALQTAKTVYSDTSNIADIKGCEPIWRADVNHEDIPSISKEIKLTVPVAEETNHNAFDKCSINYLNEWDATWDSSRTCNITTPFQAPSVQRDFFQGNSCVKTKAIPFPLSTISKNVVSSVISDLSSAEGFCTANGKKVSVSDMALKKAVSLMNECDGVEDMRPKKDPYHHPTPSVQALPRQNAGFHTASGKGRAISTEAVLKAKSILSECDDTNQKNAGFHTVGGKGVAISTEAVLKAKSILSKCDGTNQKNAGFYTASGKGVAISTEAVLKAKALLSECDNTNNKNATNPRNIGFCTASSKPVAFSAAALLKAKTLFSDISSITEITGPIEPTRNADVKYTDAGNTLEKIKAAGFLTELADDYAVVCPASPVSLVPSLQISSNLESDLPQVNVSGHCYSLHLNAAEKNIPTCFISDHCVPGDLNKESSLLSKKLPGHSGCTVTQQRYIAQQAIDCAKALLEDKDMMGQSCLMPTEKQKLHNDPDCNTVYVEARRTRKRSVECADVTDQPPLKRRLLEEFDRTVENPLRAILQPGKSCPHGILKDRRVFNYRTPLKANITKPEGNGRIYVEPKLKKTDSRPHSTLGEGKPAGYNVPVFVPLFQKEIRTETSNRNTQQDKTRASSLFVPPFKKHRATVQETSSKPQTKDNIPHLYETLPKTFIPPTAKTQSTVKVVENKSNEKMTLASCEVEMEDCSVKSVENPSFDKDTNATLAVEDGLLSNQGLLTDAVQDLHSLQLSRDMQDMRVRKKKRQTIRPQPGHLFVARTSRVDRVSLRDAVNGLPPARYTQKQLYGYGVHQPVCGVTSENAESFRFSCHQFFRREQFVSGGGVQLADGGWLIPRNDGTAGKEEFYRALCDTPAVDPKLISEEWVYNHYRWIVWKQACMERSFPLTMGGICLTPEQVLLQLKYRYDVEVDHSRRPALRKIMERDDTAARTLVLCVCGVVCWGQSPVRQSLNESKTPQGSAAAAAKVESPVGMIWLTDGWYAIKAQLDVPLTAMLHQRRIAIGEKVIIHGAELVGSQDACSPLEAPQSLMLKICANSSRAARWDTKLGFHRDPRPFLLPISSLYSNGGPVGCVDVVILRSYPTQWMEKKPDGTFVFRSTRAEEREARRYNSSKQKEMEILFAKIQAQFEKEEGISKPRSRRQTLTHQDINSLQDGEELHEAVENDSVNLEVRLSDRQLETLQAYRRSLAERRQADLQERYRRAMDNAQEGQGRCAMRNVTPVWKLCVADSRDQLGGTVYLLNLWRPSMDLQSLLKEGSRYKVYNLSTSEGKKRASNIALQLTATKKTQFQTLQSSQEWFSAHFEPRISARFTDLQNPAFRPLCGEVDLVGYVISILEAQGSSPVLYLADENLNFVKVRCLSSLSQWGLDDLVKPMELLALCNLQLSAQPSTHIPLVFAGDLSSFSSNPKETHLQGAVAQLRNLGQGQQSFLRSAEERLSHLTQPNGLNSICSPSVSGTPRLTDHKRDARTYVTPQQRVGSLGSVTPLSRNPPSASVDTNPKSLRKRRGLEYLSRIPSPPPLCAVGTMVSPCVNKTFNPPRRSGTPCALQTPPACSVPCAEDDWVNDEELAMIDTQALCGGHRDFGT